MRFVIDESNDNQYYFKVKADNGEILCHSETYTTKYNAEHAISIIKEEAAKAPIVDLTKK